MISAVVLHYSVQHFRRKLPRNTQKMSERRDNSIEN